MYVGGPTVLRPIAVCLHSFAHPIHPHTTDYETRPTPSTHTHHSKLLDIHTCLRDRRAGIGAGPGAASEAVGLGRLQHR